MQLFGCWPLFKRSSMQKDNKFANAMANRSYAELLEIVGILRNDYQPEAILAAEEELKNRKPPVEIVETEAKKHIKKNEPIVDIANEPLEVYIKIWTFLIPHPNNFITISRLREEGYLRQAKEMQQWTFIGCGTILLIFILIFFISIWIV